MQEGGWPVHQRETVRFTGHPVTWDAEADLLQADSWPDSLLHFPSVPSMAQCQEILAVALGSSIQNPKLYSG